MATLTEVFPCFFLSCKANARVKPTKTGHGPHSSKFLCFSMYCLFSVVLCISVLYYCPQVATQMQLTNISYHNTVLKKELLKRILLSGFKLGCSIAIHTYNTRNPDSITSLSGLVFRMWIWNSVKLPELHIPPPVLCLTVARGCNSEWCLLLCGHILDIR